MATRRTVAVPKSCASKTAVALAASSSVQPEAGYQPAVQLQELLQRCPSTYHAPLEVKRVAGKGRGVFAAKDFSAGELLLASSPLALVEAAVPVTPALLSRVEAHTGSSSSSLGRSGSGCGTAGSGPTGASSLHGESGVLDPLRQPGAADLVSLLASSRLTPHQAQLVAALFSGEGPNSVSHHDSSAMLDSQQASIKMAADGGTVDGRKMVDDGGQMKVQQLSRLSPPPDGALKMLLLPTGELQVQQQQQMLPLPMPPPLQQQQQEQVRQLLGVCRSPSTLAGSVVFNCYGEPCPDSLMDQLLRQGGSGGGDGADSPPSDEKGAVVGGRRGGFVGLWADFAMLNHSCCPNTINLVGGPHHHMMVRATETIRAGEEVTVCYFGRELLAPRSVRVAATMQSHGFECGCARCQYEASLGSEVEAALEQLYSAVNELWGPRVSTLGARIDHASTSLQRNNSASVGIGSIGWSVALNGEKPAAAGAPGLHSSKAAGPVGSLLQAGQNLLHGLLLAPFAVPSAGGDGSGGGNAAVRGGVAGKQSAQWWTAAATTAATAARTEVSAVVQQLLELEGKVLAAVDEVERLSKTPLLGSDAPKAARRETWRMWFRANMYDALELRLAIWELLADAAGVLNNAAGAAADIIDTQDKVVEAAKACLEVVQAVCPGTNLHVRLALKVAAAESRPLQGGHGSPLVASACHQPVGRAVAGAVTTRLGPVPNERLAELAAAADTLLP